MLLADVFDKPVADYLEMLQDKGMAGAGMMAACPGQDLSDVPYVGVEVRVFFC